MNLGQERIRLLWAGEWPLWQSAGLALILILIATWIYLGEAKRGLAAVSAGCSLTQMPGPVCLSINSCWTSSPTSKRRGKPGKITVFLDSSESMELRDKNYSPGRKILWQKNMASFPKNPSSLITVSPQQVVKWKV